MTQDTNKYDDSASNQFQPQTFQQFTAQQTATLEHLATLEAISNQFFLPQDIVDNYLNKYYLLRWSGEYLISQMTEIDNFRKSGVQLTHQGTTYKVNFLYLSPWQLVCARTEQIYISFRLPKKAKIGTVVIKKVGN